VAPVLKGDLPLSYPTEQQWKHIRTRAASFPEEAYQFVREGLAHTVKLAHGDAAFRQPADPADESRHVTGQQLCLGMRDLAIERYGLLAQTVLHRWGVRRTEDFGAIVYAMIDRKELRSGPSDSYADFQGVYDFDEAFGALALT
jgi:uncharacterized repeat protein (TIGR04138 family)